MSDAPTSWSDEYRSGGIPSSVRDEPSTTLLWTLANWPYLTTESAPRTALDVGCGTGRNSLYLAQRGIRVVGFDFSAEAIARAHARMPHGGDNMAVSQHNLHDGLPVDDASIDLLCDIFVYKHQLDVNDRHVYRTEMHRVLSPNGRVLVALAELRDGYYSQCPTVSATPATPGTLYITDPVIDLGSVLFNLDALSTEMADFFELEMSWLKVKDGPMHGKTYRRYTLATIWRHR